MRTADSGRLPFVTFKSIAIVLAAVAVAANTRQPAAPDAPFAVTIRVDAASSLGPLPQAWRFFGADEPNYATMRDGRKLLGELGQLAPERGLLPRAQPADHRRRHPGAEVGLDQRLHARTRRASRSTTGRSSTASSIRTWSSGVRPYVADRLHARGALDQARAVPALTGRPTAKYDEIFTGWAYPPKDYAQVGASWSTNGRGTASSGTAAPKWSSWYWEVWNEPNIGYWRGTPEEFSSSTTTPSTPCAARCRRRASAARNGRAAAGQFMRDFLEHCLRGTNYATGQTSARRSTSSPSTPKAQPDVRRRATSAWASPTNCATIDDGFRHRRVVSRAERQADRHRRVGSRWLRGVPGAATRLSQRHDVFELHRRQLRAHARSRRPSTA